MDKVKKKKALKTRAHSDAPLKAASSQMTNPKPKRPKPQRHRKRPPIIGLWIIFLAMLGGLALALSNTSRPYGLQSEYKTANSLPSNNSAATAYNTALSDQNTGRRYARLKDIELNFPNTREAFFAQLQRMALEPEEGRAWAEVEISFNDLRASLDQKHAALEFYLSRWGDFIRTEEIKSQLKNQPQITSNTNRTQTPEIERFLNNHQIDNSGTDTGNANTQQGLSAESIAALALPQTDTPLSAKTNPEAETTANTRTSTEAKNKLKKSVQAPSRYAIGGNDKALAGGPIPSAPPPRPIIVPPVETVTPRKDVIVNAQVTRDIRPKYPRRALRANIEATVILNLEINTNGRVIDTQLISIDAARYRNDFIKAAERAANKTRFTPKMINGRPVITRDYKRQFTFRLD